MNLVQELFAHFKAPMYQKTAKQIAEIDERPLNTLITGLAAIVDTKQPDDSIKVNEWAFQGDGYSWIEFELFRDSQHGDYTFKKQFRTSEFEEHCRDTWEIPKHGFYEWWRVLDLIDKEVEIETFVEKRAIGPEMAGDYQNWLANNT